MTSAMPLLVSVLLLTFTSGSLSMTTSAHTTTHQRDATLTARVINPFPRGTYSWWGYTISHNLTVPHNATFTRTEPCDCACTVADATSEHPFTCRCACPEHTRGDTGDTGRVGEKGETGPTGLVGARGERGVRGAEGPEGPMGPKGIRGARGTQGNPGRHGRDGRSIPGPEGPPGTDGGLEKGPRGPRGPPGQRGAKGERGPAGRDLHGAAGMHGRNGNPGPKGHRGYRGPTGPAGQRGVRGPVGPTGPEVARWQTNNILGQVTAQGGCLGKATMNGYVSAVVRDCAGGESCEKVCSRINIKGGAHKGKCIDSLHVYAAKSKDEGDDRAAGLITSWYDSCSVSDCGPNYCCCSFGEKEK